MGVLPGCPSRRVRHGRRQCPPGPPQRCRHLGQSRRTDRPDPLRRYDRRRRRPRLLQPPPPPPTRCVFKRPSGRPHVYNERLEPADICLGDPSDGPGHEKGRSRSGRSRSPQPRPASRLPVCAVGSPQDQGHRLPVVVADIRLGRCQAVDHGHPEHHGLVRPLVDHAASARVPRVASAGRDVGVKNLALSGLARPRQDSQLGEHCDPPKVQY